MTLEELEKYLEMCIESEIYLYWLDTEFKDISPVWTNVNFTTPDYGYHCIEFRHNKVMKKTEETRVTSIKLTYLQAQLKYQLENVKDLKNESEILDIDREDIEESKKDVIEGLNKCIDWINYEIENLEVLAESFRYTKYIGKEGETKYLVDILDKYIGTIKDKILLCVKNLKISVEAI